MNQHIMPGDVVMLCNGVKGVVGITPDAKLVVWHTDHRDQNPHPYPFTEQQVVKKTGRIASHR